jgi:hypothetical protein
MTTAAQRTAIDAHAGAHAETLGEAVRELVDDGLALGGAYDRDPDLRADVEKLARESGMPVSVTLGVMLRFAVRGARRQAKRDVAVEG